MPVDYSNLGHEEFVEILTDLLEDETASSLLTIPGVFEILAEHFNNDVLEEYSRRLELANEQAQSDEGDDEDDGMHEIEVDDE